MSIVGKSKYFMFLALSQHVFFRHARVPIKQKVTNTIRDDQSSYPLIYRRQLPLHIFERVFIILNVRLISLQRLRVIQTNGHCWSNRPKRCKEDRQGKAKEWPI